ncbi:MAG TPA: TolC family protein [Bacteroides mediterraneensis]|uniref:TolC family protein n=2 Tax=Bacteroides TaxID=816 RepID=UPI0026ECAAA4|nr:TolC family protein [Bacteroides mediterraneensis]HJH65638.1 TolC family protein [Bacteroides mediterraneensis]
MPMIRTFLLLCAWSLSMISQAQITLESCQQQARENYPLVRQYELLQLAEKYTLSNVAKGNLPQISLSGKISYQSEATTFPFEIPGLGIKGLPKDQYQALVEIKQNVWDGGKIRHQKAQVKAVTEENARQLDTSMYALEERVNQVFFGILLLDEQRTQNKLLEEELVRNLKTVEAYRMNGTANDADVDAVQVEILQTKQQRIQLENNRTAYLRMLSLLTGKEFPAQAQLIRPEPVATTSSGFNRPELRWYEAQEQTVAIQRKGLQSGYLPSFSLFAQGAYGNPGLDILKDKFRAYYLVGARFTWNFGSLYTLKNDRKKLDNQLQKIQNERDLFLFHTQLQVAEEDGTIQSLRQQMKKDEEIIRLRENIRRSAQAKVANGTLSVSDMLKEITAENLARQAKAVHEVQLLMHLHQRKHLTN